MRNNTASARKQVFWDLESRSTANLRECGSYIYAIDPTTEPLCLAYAIDDEAPRLWLPAEPVPEVFLEIASHPDAWELIAHNWTFESAILEHVLIPAL